MPNVTPPSHSKSVTNWMEMVLESQITQCFGAKKVLVLLGSPILTMSMSSPDTKVSIGNGVLKVLGSNSFLCHRLPVVVIVACMIFR